MASTKNGIIYPDNYDKVADVPADMKALAESVDENIERINKNLDKNADELKNLQKDNTGNKTAIEAINKKNTKQDTNIQKNAKDIEANQNNIKALQVENAEVKAENERLRSDIESISLPREAEGESIDLDDSSGARFKKFGVGGNHSQETRKGYNLLENEGTTQTINGVTITKQEDGTLIVSGTATDRIAYPISSNFKLYSANTYRLSGCPSGGGSNSYQLIAWNEVWTSLGSDNGSGKVITLSEDTKITIRLNIMSGTVCNNLVFKPMLVAGETQKPYEQYGATPSLEFPSEIKTVKDNVNIVVCNKNILKILGLGERWEYTEKGIKNLYANPGIKISQLNLKKGQTVEIGFLLLSKVNNDISFVNFVNDKTGVIASFANIQNYNVNTVYKKKYTATDDCTIKTVLYGNVNEEIFEFQLWAEYNQISNTYIKHQEQAITMPVQQEMLEGDYFYWKKEKEVHNWNKKIFDGTENINISKRDNSFLCILTDILRNTEKDQIPPIICNMYKTVSWENRDVNNIEESISQYGLNVGFDKGDLTTVEEFKALLKSKYDAGTPVEVYYKLAASNKLVFTDKQKVVAKKKKETLHTYKNITHIYSTDETSPIMNVEYAKDPNAQNNNLQNQIDEIKQLLSTTQTSAMLLDNLQKEVESEVE